MKPLLKYEQDSVFQALRNDYQDNYLHSQYRSQTLILNMLYDSIDGSLNKCKDTKYYTIGEIIIT